MAGKFSLIYWLDVFGGGGKMFGLITTSIIIVGCLFLSLANIITTAEQIIATILALIFYNLLNLKGRGGKNV